MSALNTGLTEIMTDTPRMAKNQRRVPEQMGNRRKLTFEAGERVERAATTLKVVGSYQTKRTPMPWPTSPAAGSDQREQKTYVDTKLINEYL